MASSAKSSFVVKRETEWIPVAEPEHGSSFKHTVYMTENEIVCPKQGECSVVMIVHPDDWKMMSLLEFQSYL